MSASDNHGQSTAAWTGTGVILLGGLIISVGIVFVVPWMWIVGVIIGIAGIVAWVAMDKASKKGQGSMPEKSATRG